MKKILIPILVVIGIVLFGLGVFIFGNLNNNLLNKENLVLTENITAQFAEKDQRLAVFPPRRYIQIKPGEEGVFGFGIKNYGGDVFRYNVIINDEDIRTKCGVFSFEADSWIIENKKDTNISLSLLETKIVPVKVSIPETANPCTFRTRIVVNSDKGFYYSEIMDINIIE